MLPHGDLRPGSSDTTGEPECTLLTNRFDPPADRADCDCWTFNLIIHVDLSLETF